jgi:RNA polymerase sigma-70 factor (ECF subfamily)
MPSGQRKSFDDNELGLIAAFIKGEMAGFKFVYSLYRQHVFSYCMYYMGDRMLAEDAFQEVFIRVHTRHDQLREARALKSWVLLITRSVCLNLLRTSKFTPDFIPIGNAEDIESLGNTLDMPAMPLDHAIADDMLRLALAKIAPIYREAFLLCEFEGYDYTQIAKHTNTTEANVKVRITRAKKQLRALLAPHYQYEASAAKKTRSSRERDKMDARSKPQRTFIPSLDDVSFGPSEDTSSHGEVFA